MSTTEAPEMTAIAALRIDVDATVTVLPDSNHETLSDSVGGLIEAVPGDGTYILWVNEEGKLLELPQNLLGEGLWFLIDSHGCLAAGDWMAGPCVITGPIDDDGETTPVTDDVALTVASMAEAVKHHQAATP